MLSNHDLFAGDRTWNQLDGNIAQYKLAAASYLLQPGTPFILYGEEVGMAAADLQGDRRLRAPMPWTGEARTAGFTVGAPFRALPANAAAQNVAAEQARPDGLLAWYRDLLRVRNAYPSLSVGTYAAPGVDGQVMAFQRRAGGQRSVVIINYGATEAMATAVDLPAGAHFRQVFPQDESDRFTVAANGAVQRGMAPQSVRVYVAEDSAPAP
jgi:glycosidase